MDKTINAFLKTGKLEGYSYLALLFIAMPLKYFYNQPEWVRIIGLLHGILFIAFMYLMLQLYLDKKLSFRQCMQSFILSIIPFGTFFLKRVL